MLLTFNVINVFTFLMFYMYAIILVVKFKESNITFKSSKKLKM